MCVVSMVTDHYRGKWDQPHTYPWIVPQRPVTPGPNPNPQPYTIPTPPSRKDYEDLKKEVEGMKELLKKAKQYDIDNDEPDCEMDDKVAFVRKVAESVGVDLDEVFGNEGKADPDEVVN